MAIQIGALAEVVSGSFGVEVITLAANVGQGADQECREVIIWPHNGKEVYIGQSAAAALAGPRMIDGAEQYLRLPIVNTNLLYFYGDTGDKVNLIWRL